MIKEGENYNENIIPENEFRKNILAKAKIYGCDIEIRNIMNRYDKILKQCTNEKEKKEISIMGIAELHRTMNCYGPLVVEGREIIPGSKG